jgi:putative ABC transport system ATP-binding protein
MLIQLKNLTKTYQHHDGIINAVDDLSLDIPKGSFVTITGASGSGKTTLLLILGGLLRPTSGKMRYNGNEINLHNDEELANFRSNHVGFVMQSFALVPYLTALENIMIALNVKSSNTTENRKRALELLEWVGLEDRTTHYPKELSAGQQQRVAIARSLANNPDLLLADEPTGNLDPGLSEEILGILKEINLKQKTTVVMVTHSPMAAEYGDTKIQLKNGKLHHLDSIGIKVNMNVLIN